MNYDITRVCLDIKKKTTEKNPCQATKGVKWDF